MRRPARPSLTALLLTLAAAGCSFTPSAPPRVAFDLGPAPAAATAGGGPLAWRIADVTAPPWLSSDAMVYRLSYLQAQQPAHYRDSHWRAPPPALLAQRLRQQLAPLPGCAGRHAALLSVHLDEFEQRFTSPTHSEVLLQVQATLWPEGSGTPLQQRWQLARPAAPDAPGGARALAQAVDDWLLQLQAWLADGACRSSR